MEEGTRERRQFPRIKVELIVRYKILSIPEQEFDAKTKDIGGGGVCLITREQIEPGTILLVDIKFPRSNRPILATGRVIWHRESSLGPSPAGHVRFDNGIEFLKISDSDRQRIIDHVKSEQEKAPSKDWKIGLVKDLSK